jgi:hypothetical protein
MSSASTRAGTAAVEPQPPIINALTQMAAPFIRDTSRVSQMRSFGQSKCGERHCLDISNNFDGGHRRPLQLPMEVDARVG